MSDKETARAAVRAMLDQLRALLSDSPNRKVSESDTKAYFIDPLLSALGFSGLEDISREYYIRDSREFIDYILYVDRRPIMAIEAKHLHHELDNRDAAQLVQYASIEGIEWCALGNGRRLQLYNQFLKAPLAGKLIADFDLIAFNTEKEFDALFDDLWLLSKHSWATPSGLRAWMEQRRFDAEVRRILTSIDSASVQAMRDELRRADIDASAEAIVQWFRSRLLSPSTSPLPSSESDDESLLGNSVTERFTAPATTQSKLRGRNASSELQELIRAGAIAPPVQLEATYRGHRFTAEIQRDGTVLFGGRVYTSLSQAGGTAKNIAAGIDENTKIQPTNGWEFWKVMDATGKHIYISELRRQSIRQVTDD